MKIKLNWALFLLTAVGYVFYPVWHLPLPWSAQWLLLNLFILLSIAVLYSPLEKVSLGISLPELKEIWPAVLFTAAVCLPFWLLPFPTATDNQSHAGPAAWFLGRLTSWLGINILILPLLTIPALAILAAGLRACKDRLRLPGCGTTALVMFAAGNLFFFASIRFGLADAIGKFETVLRYPPLSKFLYTGAYLLFGVHEFPPRIVQFIFMLLTAVCMLRLLRFLKANPPPRLTYLLIAFFPTFFTLSTSAELEAGTVFFFTISMYHFIKGAKTGEKEEFLKCAFWTTAGLYHKRLLLGLLFLFLPALAFLWAVYRDKASSWFYGLRSLAIPAAVGLPFLVISTAYGIRGSGLRYANLADPALMLLTLKNAYQTCGILLTSMLAFSVIYSAYRHKGLEISLLLYFSAGYYFMISATEAVGYLRHAQPFYIAPVFLLALWAADSAPTKLRGRNIRPAYLLLLPLLIFQAVFVKDAFQRTTFFTPVAYDFPYWEVAHYLKNLGDAPLSVYAPMEVEPSHFYLAKSGLAGKITWDRTLPPAFSAKKAAGIYGTKLYDFMLLPYSPFPHIKTDFRHIADGLSESGEFTTEKIFESHGNRLILLKRAFM